MQWEAPQPQQQPQNPNMKMHMEDVNLNPPAVPNVGNQMEEEMIDQIDLIGESLVELRNLNEVKVYLFKET